MSARPKQMKQPPRWGKGFRTQDGTVYVVDQVTGARVRWAGTAPYPKRVRRRTERAERAALRAAIRQLKRWRNGGRRVALGGLS